MKNVEKYVLARLREEEREIKLLENDAVVIKAIVDNGITESYFGRCSGCEKMLILDTETVGDTCIIRCNVSCAPMRCPVCKVYHMDTGVEAWKKKQKRKRKLRERLSLN
jgi:hypothetical protein